MSDTLVIRDSTPPTNQNDDHEHRCRADIASNRLRRGIRAYRGYRARSQLSDETVDRMVGAIDSAFRGLQDRLPQDEAGLHSAFASAVVREDQRAIDVRSRVSDSCVRSWAGVHGQCDRVRSHIPACEAVIRSVSSAQPAQAQVSDPDRHNLETLQRDGLHAFPLTLASGSASRQTWWKGRDCVSVLARGRGGIAHLPSRPSRQPWKHPGGPGRAMACWTSHPLTWGAGWNGCTRRWTCAARWSELVQAVLRRRRARHCPDRLHAFRRGLGCPQSDARI